MTDAVDQQPATETAQTGAPTLPMPGLPAVVAAPAIKPPTRGAKIRTEIANEPIVSDTPVTAMATLASVFEVRPANATGVWLVDPRAVEIDPMNARFGVPFVATKRSDLIQSMAAHGNTVPVKLRRMTDGPGFRCVSGAQRLGAALVIQQQQPGFRLRAVVHEHLSDADAFALGEADNAGRTDVSAIQLARHWGSKLTSVYGGDQRALADAVGKSASVVSRTLALLVLPDYVLACCADPEALTPYFAEQLVPRLGDPAAEPTIRRRAEAMVAAGRTLPGPKLVRALLDDAPAPPAPANTVWSSADHALAVTVKASRKGGRFDVTLSRPLRAADKRQLVTAIAGALDALGGTRN